MHYDHRQVIAIDGPGAAGKSTVARELAERIGAMLFDTGGLYRAVTLAAVRNGIPGDDSARLADLARSSRVELRPPTVDDGRQVDVLLEGEDVTWAIRTPEIDARVSEVSAHAAVRQQLLEVQRRIADGARVVMVGRDIGTVVAPCAGLKVFLVASTAERARRRQVELAGRGIVKSFDDVLSDLEARDAFDSARKTAPLQAADDAIVIDTDRRSIPEITEEIEDLVRKAWLAAGVTG